jgi:hypothetical protein
VPVAGNPLKTTLPVAKAHVGWDIVPTVGAEGVTGCVLIITLAEATDVQVENSSVTVKVYVPAESPDNVELVPVPVLVVPPGFTVNVHVPVAGNPFRITPPVATAQVGWIMVPEVGVAGVAGWVFITTPDVTPEIQPEEFETVYEYVPAGIPVMVETEPVPVVVIPPGDLVTVHVPVAGNPLKSKLPVADVQEGWVIVPTTGVVGEPGCAIIATLADEEEGQPDELDTV